MDVLAAIGGTFHPCQALLGSFEIANLILLSLPHAAAIREVTTLMVDFPQLGDYDGGPQLR